MQFNFDRNKMVSKLIISSNSNTHFYRQPKIWTLFVWCWIEAVCRSCHNSSEQPSCVRYPNSHWKRPYSIQWIWCTFSVSSCTTTREYFHRHSCTTSSNRFHPTRTGTTILAGSLPDRSARTSHLLSTTR